MPEIFRTIPFGNDQYSISNEGRVMRNRIGKGTFMGRVLRPGRSSRGYLIVCLYDGSSRENRITKAVHKLVAKAFLGPCPKGLQVNHKDGIKQNNHVENLEYVSPSRNSIHAVEFGLKPFGKSHWEAKKTHCPNGHAYTPENIFPYALKRGIRVCRICKNASERNNRHFNHQSLLTV